MRTPAENITMLQKQINDLQLENQILKNLLERSGISYRQETDRIREAEQAGEYDPDQGARIIHPKQITDEMANGLYTSVSPNWYPSYHVLTALRFCSSP